MSSNWLAPNGEFSRNVTSYFEKELNNKVLLTNSGTSALHLAMKALNNNGEYEVIFPSYTFAASIYPSLYEGLTPVFVDVDPETWLPYDNCGL